MYVCNTCIWYFRAFQEMHYSRLSVSVCKGVGSIVVIILDLGYFRRKGGFGAISSYSPKCIGIPHELHLGAIILSVIEERACYGPNYL
jgi:hypothetical protein